MSISNDVTMLTARFADEWETLYPSVTWLAENMPSERPSGTYVQLRIEPYGIEHRAGGSDNPFMETNGRVIVQICVPNEGGTGDAWEMADAVRSIFHMWRDPTGELRCKDSEFRSFNATATDPYFRIVVGTFYESLRHA